MSCSVAPGCPAQHIWVVSIHPYIHPVNGNGNPFLLVSPSAKVGSYLDRVLVRRADSDFISCPTFHLRAWTDHKLLRVSLWLANRPSLAAYWKFHTSLLEIQDFRDRLESLIKRALVGAVTWNRLWISLKHRIRDFATKYGRQLNLDWTKEAKSIDDRLSRTVAGVGLPNRRPN